MTQIIEARTRTVGGLPVARCLPTRERRSVGAFVFLDELGPVTLPAGEGLDVPPHPHIGLSTLTYRLSGELVHRDSLGCTQVIRPEAVNWMTAGAGIAHSERSAPSERGPALEVHGVQLWAALPPDLETCEPSFEHHPAEALPRLGLGAVDVRIIAGAAFGEVAPVTVHSRLFCAEARWSGTGALTLDPGLGERAAYPLVGEVEHEGVRHGRGRLVVFDEGERVELTASEGTRVLLIGGDPREAPLHMHWNYVASDPARIDAAKRRWADGGFGDVVGDAGARAEDPMPGKPGPPRGGSDGPS